MKRVLKWGCLLSSLLIIGLLATAWQQVRQIRENLAVSQPLPLTVVRQDPQRVRQLAERSEQAAADRVLRLKDPELTYIAQRAVKHPEVLALLEKGRKSALGALAAVPDPMGFLDGLRLDAVDLTRLLAEVRVADSRLGLSLTAPYLDGKSHLNVQLAVTGGWAPAAVRVEVVQLTVGALDVLDLPLYGRYVRDQVDEGVKAATRVEASGPLEDVRVEANTLVLRLSPDGARTLSGLARTYLK